MSTGNLAGFGFHGFCSVYQGLTEFCRVSGFTLCHGSNIFVWDGCHVVYRGVPEEALVSIYGDWLKVSENGTDYGKIVLEPRVVRLQRTIIVEFLWP